MRYKAFISYSHQDERWGARLHKRLETFKFPRRVIGQQTDRGPVPENLKPVFRDKVELSAGANLSEALQRRLRESENLIVICSPRSAQSYWVNEEILFFKRHNNPDNIFAFIIDGEPNAENPDDECFPPALKFALDDQGEQTDIRAEPLAADARKQGEGPRLALLRILAGMAGLGLDDLVRRDLQRARRRVTGITVGAASAMLIMGALTGIALDARGEAEARKDDAEGLIEFMLTDLRDKLEPVGRLDALDAVGQRASDYYDQYDLDALDADSVGRYAKVNHLIGDIQLRMGNITEAKKYFDPVYETTKRQLEADPNNPDRIYEHIQSVFWVARPFEQAADHDKFYDLQKRYLELAKQLNAIEGESLRSQRELAYGYSNVGRALFKRKEYESSKEFLLKSIPFYENALEGDPSPNAILDLSIAYSEIANSVYWSDGIEKAYIWQTKRSTILEKQRESNPQNFQILTAYIWSKISDFRYEMKFENFDNASNIVDETLRLTLDAKEKESDSDEILRAELTLYEFKASLAKRSNNAQDVEYYSEIYGALLSKRLNDNNSVAFDNQWDYQKPLIYIRNLMTSKIMEGDVANARRYLDDYELLMSNILEKNGEKRPYQTTRTYYLLSKTLLDHDQQAYVELLNPKYEPYLAGDNSQLTLKLIEFLFCHTNDNCPIKEDQFSGTDLSSKQFMYFKKIHPKTAQTIERNAGISRREK